MRSAKTRSLNLVVKPDVLAKLSELADLSAPEFDDLTSAMEAVSDSESPLEIIKALERQVQVCDSRRASSIGAAVLPLAYMYVADGYSAKTVVEAVVRGIEENKSRTELSSKAGLSLFRKRLILILGNRTIALRAKATNLVSERGIVMTGCRVISDVRPVYGFDASTNLDAFSVIHTLVLACQEGDVSRKYHIAIDNRDIGDLQEALARALDKENALDKLLDKTGLSKIIFR